MKGRRRGAGEWTEHVRAGQWLRWDAAMLVPNVAGADYEADCPVEGVCGARTAPVGAPLATGRGLSDWLSAAEQRHVQERRALPAHDVGVVAQVLADPEGCRAPARVAPRVKGGDRDPDELRFLNRR